MKSWKAIVAGLVALILVAIVVAFFNAKFLFKAVLRSYLLTNYSLAVDFVVAEVSWNGLTVTNVNIGQGTILPLLQLDWRIGGNPRFQLKKARVEIHKLRVEDFTHLSSGESNLLEMIRFETAKSVCEVLQRTDVMLTLDEVIMADRVTRLGLSIKDFLFTANADHEGVRVALVANLNCISDVVEISLPDLHLAAPDFDFHLRQGVFQLKPDQKLFYQAVTDFSAKSKVSGQEVRGKIEGLRVKGTFDFLPQQGELSLNANRLSVAQGKVRKADVRGINLIIKQFALDKRFEGVVTVLEAVVKGEENKSLIGKMSVRAVVQGTTKDVSATLNSIEIQGSRLPGLKVSYTYDTSAIRLEALNQPPTDNTGKNWMDIVPAYKDMTSSLKGSLALSGFLNFAENNKTADLQIRLEKVFAKFGENRLQNARLVHRLARSDSPVGIGESEIAFDELDFGAKIQGFVAGFKIADEKSVDVTRLTVTVQGAEVVVDPFSVFFAEKTTSPLQLKVGSLEISKILSLALGESVSAQGTLGGHARIEVKNGKPFITSSLFSSQKPGWIRYRPPGSTTPSKRLDTSDPVDILKSYLYDFNFESLSIDIVSDDKLQMKMGLHAYGRNPNYLNGKPLKLNINLEQNLLAAFKSLVMTYQLPEAIKKKIGQLDIK